MNNSFDIEKLDRRMPYTVPDGFFEKSYQRIMNATVYAGGTGHAKTSSRRRLTAIISSVAGAAAVVLVTILALQRGMPATADDVADDVVTAYIDNVVDNMSDEELDTWAEYTDPDMYLASY